MGLPRNLLMLHQYGDFTGVNATIFYTVHGGNTAKDAKRNGGR